jgi:hypothetical protein
LADLRPAPALHTEHAGLAGWTPVIVYLVMAAATLGVAAATATGNMLRDQPNADIWQHVAAIRALMDNLTAPQNPFVTGTETSRHFQPLWVATAALARLLDLTVWQAVTGATFAIMATLALAVHVFARTFFRSPWAPCVLLAVMLFGWSSPLSHTGLHSFWTLLFGAGYPATLMIALSLLQWAVVIRALGDRRYLVGLAVLSALMFATHQLGAVIGGIGAVCFALVQPDVPVRRRIAVLAVMGGGTLAASAWPYFNPLMLVLSPGNSSWEGGPDFYGRPWIPEAFLPSILGVLWMRQRQARPLAAVLVLYGVAYLLGLTGVQIASRFLMPVVLVLHIGLAALVLQVLQRTAWRGAVLPRAAPWLATAGLAVIAMHFAASFQAWFEARDRTAPGVHASAERMTRDVPDDEPVAAFGLTAWPVVATGQRVLSIPWPEPGIADLADRQAATAALFAPGLSAEARRALAANLGVRVLMVDRRFLPPEVLAELAAGAVAVSLDGTLDRFDLWP